MFARVGSVRQFWTWKKWTLARSLVFKTYNKVLFRLFKNKVVKIQAWCTIYNLHTYFVSIFVFKKVPVAFTSADRRTAIATRGLRASKTRSTRKSIVGRPFRYATGSLSQ